jgi:O-methyltransferase
MNPVDNVKKISHRIAPNLYAQLQERWTRHRINKITQAIIKRNGLKVLAGPFAGMLYVAEPGGSSLPKLLGSYETELHQWVTAIINTDYRKIINVGCAEGYYAVGLALKVPETRVFAFDIDPRPRQLCEKMAEMNGVSERVEVRGECNCEGLDALLDDRSLVIMDCEGCELPLLDPGRVPNLRVSDVLVELHDFIDRSISPTIISRFADTHDISLVSGLERDPSNYPALETFNDWDRRVAVTEFRPERMQWAFMRAKHSA